MVGVSCDILSLCFVFFYLKISHFFFAFLFRFGRHFLATVFDYHHCILRSEECDPCWLVAAVLHDLRVHIYTDRVIRVRHRIQQTGAGGLVHCSLERSRSFYPGGDPKSPEGGRTTGARDCAPQDGWRQIEYNLHCW